MCYWRCPRPCAYANKQTGIHLNNAPEVFLSYIPKKFRKAMLIASLDTYFMSSALFNQKLIVRSCEVEEGRLIHSIIRKVDGKMQKILAELQMLSR